MRFKQIKLLLNLTLRQARRLIVGVLGGTVVLLGLIMILTPGPAFVVIPIGLAILAAEFVWARRLLRRIRVSTKWKMRELRNSTRKFVSKT